MVEVAQAGGRRGFASSLWRRAALLGGVVCLVAAVAASAAADEGPRISIRERCAGTQVTPGGTVTLHLQLSSRGNGVGAFRIEVQFDPDVLELPGGEDDVRLGPGLDSGALFKEVNNAAGKIRLFYPIKLPPLPEIGDGTVLAEIDAQVKAGAPQGCALLGCPQVEFSDLQGKKISGGECEAGGVEVAVDRCAGVTCPAETECRWGGECNPETGECEPGEPKPLSTPCEADGDPCTIDHCDGQGTCVFKEMGPPPCGVTTTTTLPPPPTTTTTLPPPPTSTTTLPPPTTTTSTTATTTTTSTTSTTTTTVPPTTTSTTTTTTTSTTTTTTTLPVHYMCYAVKEVKKRCQQDPAVKCKIDKQGVDSCEAAGMGPCMVGFRGGVRVELEDQFGAGSFEVKKPVELCAPADKEGEEPGAELRTGHLEGYQVKASKVCSDNGRPCRNRRDCSEGARCGKAGAGVKARVVVVNQLGTLVLETVNPDRLLVPTGKDLSAPRPPIPAGLHHYECYTVRALKGVCEAAPSVRCKSDADCPAGICSGGFPKGVAKGVRDQFADRLYVLKRPTHLCAPVDKDGEEPGAPAESVHYVCYQAKALKKRCVEVAPVNAGGSCRREEDCGGVRKQTRLCVRQAKPERVDYIHVSNQFGDDLVKVTKELELCVPSRKIAPGHADGGEHHG